jgi:hypothetical protein
MLPIDSLVLDLIFEVGATPSPEALIAALGGKEVVSKRKLLDPDTIDPTFEMTMAPSTPFRRRGERRLLIIDDSVAPLRKDPEVDPIARRDLRPEKLRLIALCALGGVRLGRLNGLAVWGDAVLVARSARDLRGIALIPWVLDPTLDVDGKRRAKRLTQAEFEEKILAYDKRLDELDEQQILHNLGPANFERHGELVIVDVLDNKGHWDLRASLAVEDSLAAIEQFSLLPGAPRKLATNTTRERVTSPRERRRSSGETADLTEETTQLTQPPAPPPPKDSRSPIEAAEVGGQLVLIFPRDRFDLDVAAAIGKRDWETVLRSQDQLEGRQRDRMHRDGAGFIAPLEYLSEVFFDGKPLTRAEFDTKSKKVGAARVLEVHCPRFGPVMLLDLPDRGRFISSERGQLEEVLALIR